MNHVQKAAYYTLGCKLNFAETSTIARQLTEAGVARVEFEDRPDIFVINTCSVTEHANRKCRNIVNRARKINPEGRIIVVGCYAQLKPAEIVSIPGVDLVLGANDKFNVQRYLDVLESESPQAIFEEIKLTRDFVPSWSAGDRTRSFLKVQDGCNYFCAFCTIPLARGRSRSADIASTVAEAHKVAQSGVKEVVLTGVNIGDFGTAHDETFLQLITALEKVEGIERYRISSIEPNLLSNEIIEFVISSKKFAPHFHVPLQSGSDMILQSMRRRYRSELYKDRVEKIKSLNPHACIGVDVICGFPGETEEEFQKTYTLLQELPVSYFHVFTYSERPNTTAVRKDGVVPRDVRLERSRMLRILSEKKKRAFYESQAGKAGLVLFEGTNDEGWMHGFSENYVKVRVPFQEELVNTLEPVMYSGIDIEGFMRILSPEITPI